MNRLFVTCICALVALSYAEQLLAQLKAKGVKATVMMGGTLNQDVEGEDLPRDMGEELERLGIKVCREIDDIYPALQGVV